MSVLMAATGGRASSNRETVEWTKFFLSIGILFSTSLAGGIWATLVSSNYFAFWDGLALGFFTGATLVMTALLASMRSYSESWEKVEFSPAAEKQTTLKGF